jgi:hypothetical protein
LEPVISLPGFEAFANLREGFTMVLRGDTPDENGDPVGEHVEIEVIVPPPSFYMLKQMQAKQAARTEPVSTEQAQVDIIDMIWACLKRNYRGIPRWLIEQSLDTALLLKLNEKMREMSGLVEAKKETGTAP